MKEFDGKDFEKISGSEKYRPVYACCDSFELSPSASQTAEKRCFCCAHAVRNSAPSTFVICRLDKSGEDGGFGTRKNQDT